MFTREKYRRDSGFTIIEVVVVIAIISIMTNLFTNILVSATQIYVDHGIRKTRHIDSRRAMEMASRDVRELNTWTSVASSTVLDFRQVDNFQRTLLFTTYTYYDLLRTRYNITSPTFTYQNETGTWGNLYYVLDGDVVASSTNFSTTTLGGKERVSIVLILTVNNKPMRYRTTIFPRKQGG